MFITPKVKKYLLTGLSYLIILFVISQGVSWWKSRNALSGNLSEFNVELMDGSRFMISEFSGEPVLFHFWATWCPVCDLQKGSIESIAKDYLGISVASWSEGEAEVKSYIQENGLTFPVLLDESGQLARYFGLKGVPASFILSPGGEIKFVESGYTTELGLRFRLWLSSVTE